MSGGYFDYNQYQLGDIADSIEQEIKRATGPKPPLITKEYVSVCRVVPDSRKLYLSFRYPTFDSALRDFTKPEYYEI